MSQQLINIQPLSQPVQMPSEMATFSAEVVTLLMRREYLWGSITIASHVVGSLVMTVAGIVLIRVIYQWSMA